MFCLNGSNAERDNKFHFLKLDFSNVCPFDGLPCGHVNDCDDALSLVTGFDWVEGSSCGRAVRRVVRK